MKTLPAPSSRRAGPQAGARWLLLTAAGLSLTLWFIPGAEMLAYPLHLFVTYVHEGGHALMTVLTGGSVHHIAIAPNTSGVTLSEGGFSPLIYMAGYVGATAFGAACLQLMRRPGAGHRTLVFMATVVLLTTGLWIRPWGNAFGFAMGLAVGGGLLAAARFLNKPSADFLAAFLAVQLCLNALFDLRNLVWITTNQARAANDARFMADAFGLTPWFWALLWAAIAAAILGASLRSYWRGKPA